ncbi:MAG: metal-binding protein [Beijerinckiaceae bacterium]|nr:MAG: metal-binding protein [Beijerinckiaceae bacterium]
MTEALLEVLLRRDRIVVTVALAALTALAWNYVLWLAADMGMGGMDMTGFRMIPAGIGLMVPARSPWTAIEFAYALAMWAVMMVGMMIPSAAPMILIYARVGRQVSAQGKPFAATGWFATGYLLAWFGFSLVATAAQWALERAALLDSMMAGTSQVFSGIVLITAGVYQWSPLKDTCLAQCQSPLLFIHRHGGFHRDPSAALALGLHHGAHCVGCCWALMALLFVGGVMNVLWIATISAFVLIEKIVPVGRLISRIAGLGFVAAGAWIVVGSS